MAIPFLNNAYFAAKVGIGETNPSGNLVIGSGAGTGGTSAVFSGWTGVSHGSLSMYAYGNNTPTIKFSASDSGTGGGVTYINSGNVGIGTTNPIRTLHVVGGDGGTGTHIAQFEGRSGVVGMYVRGDGSVGIGTTSPGTINGVAFSSVGLHTKFGTLGRTITEGTSWGEYIMNHSGESANRRAKFIQSKAGDINIGSYDDNGTQRLHARLDNSGTFFLGNTSTAYQTVFFDSTPGTVYGNGTLQISPLTSPGSGVAQFTTNFADRVSGGTTKHNVRVGGTVTATNFIGGSGAFLPLAGGAMTGAITLIDGSTTTTSINFTGDANTGIYQPANNLMGFVSNGSRKLLVDTAGVTVQNGNLFINSDSTSSSNNRIMMGAGSDLQIYHDGSHSYIQDVGTGDLKISSNTVRIESNGAENMIIASANGSVSLYYNNVKKFETTSAGAAVTGSLTVTNDITATGDLTVRDIDARDLTLSGKATSLATAASDGVSTLTTKSYVDGLVTGVPVYKGTWDARNVAEGGTTDGGTPDLRLAANKVLGNYYIVSTAGSGAPNGAGVEPDSWAVGDWCIFSDVTPGAGTDLWQRIDNSSVISGAGTGQTVALWEGATNAASETLTNAPITVSGNNTTFAGNVLAEGSLITRSVNANLTISGDTNGNIYYNSASGEHRWRASGSSVNSMSLSSSLLTVNENATFAGNVGIGTTSPAAGLQVAKGSTTIPAAGASTASAVFGNSTSDDNYGVAIGANSSGVGYISSQRTDGNATTYNLAVQPNGGNVGIGATAPLRKLHVAGGSGFAVNASTTQYYGVYIPALGEGSNPRIDIGDWHNAGSTIKWDSSARSLNLDTQYSTAAGTFNITGNDGASTFLTILPSGNVGIGTTSPVVKLDVASTSSQYVAKFSHSTGTGFAPGSILLEAGQSTSRGQGMYHYNTEADENWFTGVAYNVSSKKWIVANKNSVVQATDTAQLTHALMTIDSDTGNVGIGTTSPDAKLEIKTDGETTNFVKLNSTKGTGNIYGFKTNGSNSDVLAIMDITAGNRLAALGQAEVSFNTGGTTRLLINSSGSVGIGTTSPQTKLQIGPLTGGDGTAQERLRLTGDYYSTGSGALLRFTNQHNNGANPNTGEYNLAGVKAYDFRSDWGGALALQTAPNTSLGGNLIDRLTINPEGLVGIGTTSPSSKLQVAGGIQMADDTATPSADKVGTMRYRTGTEYVDVDGTEIIVDGNFSVPASWVVETNWSISGGQLVASGATGSQATYQVPGLVAGKIYRVQFEITAYTSGTIKLGMGTSSTGSFFSGVGIHTEIVTAAGTLQARFMNGNAGSPAVSLTIDNASVVEVVAEDASYADMCMQTGASTYEWVNIVRNTY